MLRLSILEYYVLLWCPASGCACYCSLISITSVCACYVCVHVTTNVVIFDSCAQK